MLNWVRVREKNGSGYDCEGKKGLDPTLVKQSIFRSDLIKFQFNFFIEILFQVNIVLTLVFCLYINFGKKILQEDLDFRGIFNLNV